MRVGTYGEEPLLTIASRDPARAGMGARPRHGFVTIDDVIARCDAALQAGWRG